ncbi:MAG: cytochrome c3 family protein [Armatimonadetes bacterium]|nr:cytochrome c3 family protein [Armatimonadota bacterium]
MSLGLSVPGQQTAAPESEKPATEATYVGSDACKGCHKDVSESWATNPHAKALSAEGLSDSLKGCEACHGPGSAHIADPIAVKPVSLRTASASDTSATCGKCHFSGQPGAAEGKTIEQRYWRRSEHKRNEVSCLGCHSAHVQSEKLLKKQTPDVCGDCHQAIVKKGDYQHTPVAGGACLSCHDPHGSTARHQLVSDLPKVCSTCHSPKAEQFTTAHHGMDMTGTNCIDCHAAHSRNKSGHLLKAKLHTPFESGQCEMCHKDGTKQLVKSQKELCTMCHSKELAKAPTDGIHMHPPVAEGMCTSCHSPHASDAPKALWRDKTIAYSCFLCHNKIESGVDAKFAHLPVSGLNCTTCHTPHMSKEKKLLVKDSIELCKKCHQPHLHPLGKKPDGKVVVDPTTNEMLTCASCHEPHGSDFDKLTKKDKNAELCTMCHAAGMG